MPEADVVYRTAAALGRALNDTVLSIGQLRWGSLGSVDLAGQRVTANQPFGKHLLTRLDGGMTLRTHLRMEGSWRIDRAGTRPVPGPRSSARVILANENWVCSGFRLGMVDLIATEMEDSLIGHLGPDIRAEDAPLEQIARRIADQTARPSGAVLLDQNVTAGIGTFYMAETLFELGLSPWLPFLNEAQALAAARYAHRMIRRSITTGRPNTTGDLRPNQHSWVHGRLGKPCRACGTRIAVGAVGVAPQTRPAFYCPQCQPGPTPPVYKP